MDTDKRLDALSHAPDGYGAMADELLIEFTRKTVGDRPYKGTDSYQFEDSQLFFGRSTEENEMVSRFLKGRLCILNAPSGAGKTSILNARVIPRIEESGIHTVRLTPQSDPLEAVRVASILQLIPPPECETAAIAAMLENAPELADQPLEVVLEHFDAIPAEAPERRNLLAAFEVQKLWFDPYRFRSGLTTPFFCKLLAGSIDIRDYWRHLGTFFSFDQIGADIEDDLWKGATLAEIHTLMASKHARAAHREWLDTLDLPEFGFVRFFAHFWDHWAQHQPGYALCVIIDQFEQIFTLYTDDAHLQPTDGADKPDWRLRPSFFDELRKLLAPVEYSDAILPISVVLSMRDEYLGQLGSVADLASARETSHERLGFLTIADARRAIAKPAQAFGYDYDEGIYEDIISSLKKEDRYIEPAHIQIVCEKIWKLFGRDLAGQAGGGVALVSYDDFIAKTGGTVKIQQEYFREILETFSADDQLEILDMLSDLLTQSSRRNVVEYTTLVGGALRDHAKRADLVGHLQANGIIRQEERYGSKFVEISHEFLIAPLQAEIVRHVTQSERVFRFAQRAAAGALLANDLRTTINLSQRAENLTRNAVLVLLENAHRCTWRQDVLDLILHAAVQRGLSVDDFRALFAIYDRHGAAPTHQHLSVGEPA